MAIGLTLTVEEPDRILDAGEYGAGALMRLQSSSTEAGAYADVTGTGATATITVVTGTRSYSAYDPNGTESTWYRTRFENVGATRLSSWSPAFQPAPEGSGLICALWDVKQSLGITATNDDETITEYIRQVGNEIAQMTGRQFLRAPASGTATWTEDVDVVGGLRCDDWGRTLWYPKGLANLTTLEVATTSQPESGGTYTTVTAAEAFLRPVASQRDDGWPATRITLSDTSSSRFYPGYNTVRITGARGFDTVPYNIQGIAQRATVAAYLSKGSGGTTAAVGPTGALTMLRHISPADREALQRYAVINV